MVAKSFPRKQVPNKNFHQHFLVETFYGCKIISMEIGSYQKFSSTFFGRKFFMDAVIFLLHIFIKIVLLKIFMVAKSFPRKQVPKKNFIIFFLSEIFHCCKIISSKIGSYQKFSLKYFWSIIFMGAKTFPRTEVLTEIFHRNFFVENFLWLQNHFLENRFL